MQLFFQEQAHWNFQGIKFHWFEKKSVAPFNVVNYALAIT